MTHHEFVSLVNQLRGDFREPLTRPSTSLSENRWNNKLHILNVEKRKRNCIVCANKKTPGGGKASNSILL